ncbi:site-specific integrase [Xanthomonas tesorieronis]|uniref:site-specific integrase n=1 Tax=Xanthomonas tesorieronis TaxID=3160839 RepID=UPI003511AEAF
MFNPQRDHWMYRDVSEVISLRFSKLCLSRDLEDSAKVVLVWYAERMASSHLRVMFQQLLRFALHVGKVRGGPVAEFNDTDLINYRASLDARNLWSFGQLSTLLRRWYELGCAGVPEQAYLLLKQIRNPGVKKGRAVLTHDPVYGPFTDIELETLQRALDHADKRGDVSKEGYVLAYLCMLLGQRPVQHAALKVRDISVVEQKGGAPVYLLRMPRAKQRGSLVRSAFKDRLVIPQIGKVLVEYADGVKKSFEGVLEDPSEAPLFPATSRSHIEPDGFRFHRTAKDITDLLRSTLDPLKVRSERTGEQLRISSVRFRRTFATRAAIEGHGELVIAELLDHSDTQNVGVYIEARPEIVERIDKAIAFRLAPLAQAFSGVLIENESHATRHADPTSRICDPRFDPSMRPIGSCGSYGFCGFLAPIACYTCVNFEPWVDGPHHAVLEHLVDERERLSKDVDARIAAVNDRTILAVAEVIRRCETWKEGRDHGG